MAKRSQIRYLIAYSTCTSTAAPPSIIERAFSNGNDATSSCWKGPYLFMSTPTNDSIGLTNLTTICFERILAEIDSSTFGLPLTVAAITSLTLPSVDRLPSRTYFSSSVGFEYFGGSFPGGTLACLASIIIQ